MSTHVTGYFEERYTPTRRGFDSFFGYYNGFVDFYNGTYVELNGFSGYDFRKNTEVHKTNGKYLTDLLTDKAVEVIENHDQHKTGQPLFLMLSQIAPHTGNNYDLFQAPEETVAKYSYIERRNRQFLAGESI